MNKPSNLEVLLTPADFAALASRDLSGATCVVFDVLRATSTMLTALANGAARIFPVAGIPEAVKLSASHPAALLAGERDGVLIRASQTGGRDFDLGNSPREFTRERVAGREIIMTTTNGTRALQACARARTVLVAGALNLPAVAKRIAAERPDRLLLVCAGTYEEAAYEDTLVAGALCDLLWRQFEGRQISDSAAVARNIYLTAPSDWLRAMENSRNARRLLAHEALRDDVALCLRRDIIDFTAELRGPAVDRSA